MGKRETGKRKNKLHVWSSHHSSDLTLAREGMTFRISSRCRIYCLVGRGSYPLFVIVHFTQ